jgi:hypothetical protein
MQQSVSGGFKTLIRNFNTSFSGFISRCTVCCGCGWKHWVNRKEYCTGYYSPFDPSGTCTIITRADYVFFCDT